MKTKIKVKENKDGFYILYEDKIVIYSKKCKVPKKLKITDFEIRLDNDMYIISGTVV